MTNVIEFGDRKVGDVDIQICYITMPPLFIPVSDLAKEIIELEEGYDCGIFLEASAEEVMAFLPETALIQEVEFIPTSIQVLTIKPLH